MIRRNTYVISGEKEWSQFYWNQIFVCCDTKQERHRVMVNLCLRILNGKKVVMGLTRQYGFAAAWKEANIIYNSCKLIKQKYNHVR